MIFDDPIVCFPYQFGHLGCPVRLTWPWNASLWWNGPWVARSVSHQMRGRQWCSGVLIVIYRNPWAIFRNPPTSLGYHGIFWEPRWLILFPGRMANSRLLDFVSEDYVFVHQSVEKDFLDQLKLKRRLGMGIGMRDGEIMGLYLFCTFLCIMYHNVI